MTTCHRDVILQAAGTSICDHGLTRSCYPTFMQSHPNHLPTAYHKKASTFFPRMTMPGSPCRTMYFCPPKNSPFCANKLFSSNPSRSFCTSPAFNCNNLRYTACNIQYMILQQSILKMTIQMCIHLYMNKISNHSPQLLDIQGAGPSTNKPCRFQKPRTTPRLLPTEVILHVLIIL